MAKPKRKTLPKDFEEILKAGDIKAMKAVFDTCDVNARGGYSKEAALAFWDCPDELTRWLVEQGADLAAVDSYGETSLHARSGHATGFELLIELGADVNHDAGGRGTPLHRAAENGNLRAAQALLDHGARVDAVNKDGQTPLVFALQRCSNASLARMAPMAELLLGAMSISEKQESLLGRVSGSAAKQTSPVTPEMQGLVQRIGTEFEFRRSIFNPDGIAAASDALDRLYVLFNVPPVPRHVLHDGKSPITAKPGRWQDQHKELWDLLVPSGGAATTVQGELIRISGRIHDEFERNGGVNWDSDYRKMVDAFLKHLSTGRALPVAELEAARQIVAEVKGRRGDTAELCKLAVSWVALNPNPIPLPKPDYSR